MMLQSKNINVSTLDNNSTVKHMSNSQRTFSIGTVARLVGVSTHVLRVWERRYDLQLSSRNDKGRRVYSATEIEKLKLIKRALDAGYKISDIAEMSLSELSHLGTSSGEAQNVKSNKGRYLVYGERLSHWLFRSRSDIDYRTIDDLMLLTQTIHQSGVFPKGVILELDAITPEVEEMIYITRLELPENVDIWILSPNVEKSVIIRLTQAQIRVVDKPLEQRSVDDLVAQLKGQAPGHLEAAAQELQPQQLNALTEHDNPILCDCPKHLADIYIKVDEFIRYTNDCEKMSPKDSAVHQYIAEKMIELRARVTQLTLDVAKMDGLDI